MDGFEGSRVVIGDTIKVASELSKKTSEANPLKKTLFGTLLKWVSDVKSVGSSTRDTGDGSPARTPEEPPQSSRNIGGSKSNTKKFTDETKRRKSAYVVPTPRSGVSTPVPKHSVSSHAHQQDLEEGPFRDLLAFRPQTPYSISTDADKSVAAMKQHCDRYRLMYLIVRLEQQQDHMRDVITSTRNYGNRQSLRLITKIKDALSKLYGTMLSIRDDDEAVYNQIGTSINDLDEFFNMVENVCSAVEDIPVERPEQGQDGLPVPGLVMTSAEGLRTFYRPGLKSVSTSQAPKLYMKEKQQLVTGRMLGAEVVPVVEKPGVAMATVWPGLNSNDKGRQKKDIELRCLMSEIDDLMVDVGLTGGKRKKNAITYEQLMVGVDKTNGAKIAKQVTKAAQQEHSTEDEEADKFIEELDQLLDDVDSQ